MIEPTSHPTSSSGPLRNPYEARSDHDVDYNWPFDCSSAAVMAIDEKHINIQNKLICSNHRRYHLIDTFFDLLSSNPRHGLAKDLISFWLRLDLRSSAAFLAIGPFCGATAIKSFVLDSNITAHID
jgi:hypothetical protein